MINRDMPTHYCSEEGGQLMPWTSGPISPGISPMYGPGIERLELGNPRVWVHALYWYEGVGDYFGRMMMRWDCVNGWTDCSYSRADVPVDYDLESPVKCFYVPDTFGKLLSATEPCVFIDERIDPEKENMRAENERLRAEIIAVRERNELLEKWRTNWYAPIITPPDRQRQERAIAALGADPGISDARLGTLAR